MLSTLGDIKGNMTSALNFEDGGQDVFPFEIPPNKAVSDYYTFCSGGAGAKASQMFSTAAVTEQFVKGKTPIIPEIVQQFEAIRQYAQPDEGETEADVDRKVFKSLFDDMTANAQLEALLTLYKAMPNAEQAGLTLRQFSDQLGLGNVSRLLTKIEDQS